MTSSLATTATSTGTTSAAVATSSSCPAAPLALSDVIGHHSNVTPAARARKKSGVRSHAHTSLANDNSPADMVYLADCIIISIVKVYPTSGGTVLNPNFRGHIYKRSNAFITGDIVNYFVKYYQ